MKKIVIIFISIFMFSMSISAINDTQLSIGTKVKYKDILFYVIGNSEDEITLLKAEPLTYDEVTLYGKVGTDEQRVNSFMNKRVSEANLRKPIDQSGYGGMAFLSSETCGYNDDNSFLSDGCINDYDSSDVKFVVDNWYNDKINFDSIKEARIPTFSQIFSLGYEWYEVGTSKYWKATDHIPSWVYSDNYFYWVTNDNDSSSELCGVMTGNIYCDNVLKANYIGVVRPVIVLNKKLESSIDISDGENSTETNNDANIDNKNEKVDSVIVPNTMKKLSIVFTILGIIITLISLFIIIKNKKTKYMLFIMLSIILFNKKIYAYNAYEIGQVVNLNGMDFYVIKNSTSKEDYVTALKKEPLTKVELERYGEGHVNRYTQWYRNEVYYSERSGSPYGGITYYSSEDCGYRKIDNGSFSFDVACSNDYNFSDIKYVVDAWSSDMFNSNELKEVNNYKARLIKVEELNDNLDCKKSDCKNSKYTWLNDSYYGNDNTEEFYWTMSGYITAYDISVYTIPLNSIAGLTEPIYAGETGMVRPVVNIYKSALGDTDTAQYIVDDVVDNVIDIESIIKYDSDGNEIDSNKEDNTKQESKNDNDIKVNDSTNESNSVDSSNNKKEEYIVPNTYKRLSILGICLGIIFISISTIVILKRKKLYK